MRSAGDDRGEHRHLSHYLTPDNFPPLEVAVVVPIAAPPALQPDGNLAVRRVIGTPRQRIEAVGPPAPPSTLAPRPETIEGLVDEGGGEAAARRRLRQLATPQQVLARPFVDVDLASLQDAGLISEANAQSDGGANVARSRLAIEPTGGVWLSGATLAPEAARQAVDLGIDRASSRRPPWAGATANNVPTTPFAWATTARSPSSPTLTSPTT